ncbi:MAG: WXG100 family type VII secretion target [Segniliparus sp.]|uniref:WXG100 family type VII secretion target n=1 Tax=Segniliparus sp. TaxID=2804064 RepID=UPI003F330B93
MSNGDIYYDHSAMEEHSSQIQSHASELSDMLDNISTAVNELAESWSGAGSNNWADLQKEWNSTAATEQESLSNLGTALSNTTSSMQETDSEVSAMFS